MRQTATTKEIVRAKDFTEMESPINDCGILFFSAKATIFSREALAVAYITRITKKPPKR